MALLESTNLQKTYGGRQVVKGVSFRVEQGEIVGLLGPNGAGKTTSFRMTCGLVEPDAGKVTLNVAPLTRKDGVFSGDYTAKVFPYWFMGEKGAFRMKVSDEDLARVAKGETVDFTGDAQNSGSEPRKVTGRATPVDATTGKIKVRIFVTEKIQLIFNTTYKFGG